MKRLLYPGQLVTGEDVSVFSEHYKAKAVITTGSSSMKNKDS